MLTTLILDGVDLRHIRLDEMQALRQLFLSCCYFRKKDIESLPATVERLIISNCEHESKEFSIPDSVKYVRVVSGPNVGGILQALPRYLVVLSLEVPAKCMIKFLPYLPRVETLKIDVNRFERHPHCLAYYRSIATRICHVDCRNWKPYFRERCIDDVVAF